MKKWIKEFRAQGMGGGHSDREIENMYKRAEEASSLVTNPSGPYTSN